LFPLTAMCFGAALAGGHGGDDSDGLVSGLQAYFGRHLRHRNTGLLTGPSPCYPEVLFAH
jgi:hypothetical protein